MNEVAIDRATRVFQPRSFRLRVRRSNLNATASNETTFQPLLIGNILPCQLFVKYLGWHGLIYLPHQWLMYRESPKWHQYYRTGQVGNNLLPRTYSNVDWLPRAVAVMAFIFRNTDSFHTKNLAVTSCLTRFVMGVLNVGYCKPTFLCSLF